MIITIVLVLFTLLLSAFFRQRDSLSFCQQTECRSFKNKGSRKGQILTDLYNDSKSFLSTMLVGNNIVLVMYTIFFSSIVTPLLELIFPIGSFAVSFITTIILTIIILIFGEFIPKTIFRLYANELIFRLARPLKFLRGFCWFQVGCSQNFQSGHFSYFW